MIILPFSIIRDEGAYRAVVIKWKILYSNGTELVVGDQFERVSGSVRFADGQNEATLRLSVISDGIPEYDTVYTALLYNVSG